MNSDRQCGWLLVLFTVLGCQAPPQDGLVKFPVTGSILVDDEPAAGVVVRFFRDGLPGKENADTPLAVTAADGTFALTTNFERDGAVAGQYKVTFTWKESNAPGAEDRLSGRYTNLEQSQFEVTVDGPTDLAPFKLSTPDGRTPKAVVKKKRRNPGLPPIAGVN